MRKTYEDFYNGTTKAIHTCPQCGEQSRLPVCRDENDLSYVCMACLADETFAEKEITQSQLEKAAPWIHQGTDLYIEFLRLADAFAWSGWSEWGIRFSKCRSRIAGGRDQDGNRYDGEFIGLCQPSQKLITILITPKMELWSIVQTLVHEMAHAVAGCRYSHSLEWKQCYLSACHDAGYLSDEAHQELLSQLQSKLAHGAYKLDNAMEPHFKAAFTQKQLAAA